MQKLKQNYKIIILVLIFLFAFALRLYKITQLDLWRDEAFTVLLSQTNFPELLRITVNDTTPPLLEIILHFWMRIFGNSEFSVRMPSLLASLGTFIYLFLIVKRYFKTKEVWAILLLFSVNMISVFYAREARAYSLMTFFLVGSVYYLLRLFECKNLVNVLSYISFSTFAFYSHNLAIFFLATEVIYVLMYLKRIKLLKNKNIIIKWLGVYAIWGALILPWLVLTFIQAKEAEAGFWLVFHPYHSLTETLTGLAVGIRLFTHDAFSLLDSILNILIHAFLLIGTYSDLKNSKTRGIFALFFWIPFVCIYLISFVMPLLYMRYVSFLAPFVVILVFQGVKFLLKSTKIIYGICILIIAGNLNVYFSYINTIHSKPPYEEMVEYYQNTSSGDDCLVHLSSTSFFPVKYYSKDRFDAQIYDPGKSTPFYTGKVLLTKDDFTHSLTELENCAKVWTIQLEVPFSREVILLEDFENKVALCEEKSFADKLFLKKWSKDEKTCNSDSNLQ